MKTVSASARALILALAVMLTLSSAACGTAEQEIDPPSYLNEPFSVEVRGELRGMAFTGVLSHHSAANGGQAFRFVSPAALAGITVCRQTDGAEILFVLEDIYIPTGEWESSDLHRLLLPLTQGRVISSSARDGGGSTAVIETSSGGVYTVSMDKNGSPLFWECDGMWMEVVGDAGDARGDAPEETF